MSHGRMVDAFKIMMNKRPVECDDSKQSSAGPSTKKPKFKPPTHSAGKSGYWKSALVHSIDPESVIESTKSFLIIKDKYPKVYMHYCGGTVGNSFEIFSISIFRLSSTI